MGRRDGFNEWQVQILWPQLMASWASRASGRTNGQDWFAKISALRGEKAGA